jgi:hypothetical protein
MAKTTFRRQLLGALALLLALGAALALTRRCGGADLELVRRPAVAGAFYPGSERELRRDVRRYLDEARPKLPDDVRAEHVRALIVPHAGYRYSGPTAALSYKLLEGRPRPSRVVLLGPSHHTRMLGACSVADHASYRTPLGDVPVDAAARERLIAHEPYHRMRYPHQREHCLEVQLPFLQVLWDDPPPIVPVLVGQLTAEELRRAAAALSLILDEETLLVVSTDFTHYGPRFGYVPFPDAEGERLRDRIRELDMRGVQHIEALDADGFRRYLRQTGATICGRTAVTAVLELLSPATSCRPVFLGWDNSGRQTGGYSDCVSYVAMAVYAPPEAVRQIREALSPQRAEEAPDATAAPRERAPLDEEHQRALLALARRSLKEAARRQQPAPGPPELHDMPAELQRTCAAFVTLKREGRLRGCIGHVLPQEPLCRCVWDMAASAACRDPRFKPVGEEELDRISVEVSVLGLPQAVQDAAGIRVGRDGLVVSRGRHRGLLLPQVAVERGWTADQFLDHACLKAGLPADAWREGEVEIQRFTAQVFGEEELGLR